MIPIAPHLLLVDDEPQFVRALKPALDAAGFKVTTATDCKTALAAVADGPFDAILLDLGLPDMDGKNVIVQVREHSNVPILVLSARDEEQEKIDSLDLGADDFVNKPFSIGELTARVRASLRSRQRTQAPGPSFNGGGVSVDYIARRVTVEGEAVRLTQREYNLLKLLTHHAGVIVTHKQIVAAVWGDEAAVNTQFVRVLVANLRSKIEAEPAEPRLIQTELGLGYRFATDDA